MKDSGYPEDDVAEAEGSTFEWWRHVSGVIWAVRLDPTGEVTGVARPLRQSELDGPAKGFDWNIDDEVTAAVRGGRHDFSPIGSSRRATWDADQHVGRSDRAVLGLPE